MTVPISTETARHYNWGTACDGWHLLAQTHLSVIQERVPPGQREVEHYHATSHQFFYILQGVATIEIGGERIALRGGEGLEVPPGTRHQFRNDSGGEVLFLVISAPPSHGDRVVTEETSTPGANP
ncbi:MAG: cupin protein [Bacteroidetes bacterium]|nr:cupin protein [Bacteroidota bacterium]